MLNQQQTKDTKNKVCDTRLSKYLLEPEYNVDAVVPVGVGVAGGRWAAQRSAVVDEDGPERLRHDLHRVLNVLRLMLRTAVLLHGCQYACHRKENEHKLCKEDLI